MTAVLWCQTSIKYWYCYILAVTSLKRKAGRRLTDCILLIDFMYAWLITLYCILHGSCYPGILYTPWELLSWYIDSMGVVILVYCILHGSCFPGILYTPWELLSWYIVYSIREVVILVADKTKEGCDRFHSCGTLRFSYHCDFGGRR